MLLYVEIHNDSTKKLLELIDELSKAAGFKVNTHTQKVAFLYIQNNLKRKLQKQCHLH